MIVLPMAGLSRRFADQGYDRPKFMLDAQGKTLFRHAVESFAGEFGRQPFLFVTLAEHDAAAFIAAETARIGLTDIKIITVPTPTRGQAETVSLGIDGLALTDATPITIFNIDTFRPGFRYPVWVDQADVAGYLEVFRGSGANWSYVRPAADGSARAIETTEKRPVSDLCCTGLYHFARAGDFRSALTRQIADGPSALQAGEWYVAPLYNYLIQQGHEIRWWEIPGEQVIFCGVPSEYEAFVAGQPRTGRTA